MWPSVRLWQQARWQQGRSRQKLHTVPIVIVFLLHIAAIKHQLCCEYEIRSCSESSQPGLPAQAASRDDYSGSASLTGEAGLTEDGGSYRRASQRWTPALETNATGVSGHTCAVRVPGTESSWALAEFLVGVDTQSGLFARLVLLRQSSPGAFPLSRSACRLGLLDRSG